MSDLQSTDDNHQDALGIAQNGGSHGAADGDIDIDDDADLDDDDDMMDKISSSPSIEDGEDAHTHTRARAPELPPTWPARVDSLRNPLSPSCSPVSSDRASSSPYLERPTYLPVPMRIPSGQSSKASALANTPSQHSCAPQHRHHHLRSHLAGEYTGSGRSDKNPDDVFYEREPIGDV